VRLAELQPLFLGEGIENLVSCLKQPEDQPRRCVSLLFEDGSDFFLINAVVTPQEGVEGRG
jgi:hypothetical protein